MSSLPRLAPMSWAFNVDGEMVLYGRLAPGDASPQPDCHRSWLCLDGSGTLAEIAHDMADVYRRRPCPSAVWGGRNGPRFGSGKGLLVGVGEPSEPAG